MSQIEAAYTLWWDSASKSGDPKVRDAFAAGWIARDQQHTITERALAEQIQRVEEENASLRARIEYLIEGMERVAPARAMAQKALRELGSVIDREIKADSHRR